MKRLLIIVSFLIASMQIGCIEVIAFYYGDAGSPQPDEVHIGKVGIVMPVGKILIVRRASDYCAIRLNGFWSENTSEVGSIFVASGSDEYAIYESYHQEDNTGDFSKKNVHYKKEELSFPKPRGIGRLAFSFGNKEINCGTITLFWSGKGAVHFYKEGQKQGDYGIELAPTMWADISEVNVFDARIKWYRYDEKRQRVNIPIDQLWKDIKNEKVNK